MSSATTTAPVSSPWRESLIDFTAGRYEVLAGNEPVRGRAMSNFAAIKLLMLRIGMPESATELTAYGVWNGYWTASLAGMAQIAVGQPFDTIKTRLQIEGPKSRFKGPLDCAIQTIQKEGIFSLYKGAPKPRNMLKRSLNRMSSPSSVHVAGMLAPLAGVSAVNAVLFAVYSRLKDAQRTHSNDPLTLFQIALAGAGAGIANTALISPVELLKIRLQGQYTPKVLSTPASAPRFHGPWDVARALYQSHGFRAGIMRGFWITLIREIPANMGFYTGFEAAKRFLTPTGSPPDSLSVPRLLLSGSFGGVCYWTCCYPLDVIKSTVQFQTFSLRSLAYIPNVAKSLYREQGARVFVRGYTPTLLRGLPAAATTFMVYEMTVRTLQHW